MRIAPVLLATAALALMTVSANATVITFEGYVANGSLAFVPPAYTESGFTLSYAAADGGSNDKAAVFGASSAGMIGDSTASLGWNTSDGSSVTLTGPASFDLFSLDLGGYVGAPGDKHTNITLTGYLTAGGSQTITFSNLLSETTENVGWTGLDHVVFTGTYYGAMDNLVTSGGGNATPEPGTMLLVVAGAGALALVRRRKSLGN
jgi:hypothetical protein